MNLSKREKVMLILLGITILIVGFYMLYIKPQLEKIQELNKVADVLQKSVDFTKTNISLEDKVDSNYKILNEKINSITRNFFPEIKQENYIIMLDGFLESSNVYGKTMSFLETEIGSIEERKAESKDSDLLNQIYEIINEFSDSVNEVSTNEYKEQKSQSEEQNDDMSLENMNATIYFQGKYENIVSFLRKIEDFNKNIIIKNLNLVKDNEDDLITGSIILQFYAVPKLKLLDEDYYQWDYQGNYGKDNPFYNDTSNKDKENREDGSKSGNGAVITLDDYDFGMWVKPITSDNTTVGVGKYGDSTRESYVYADNVGVESVKITFKIENNKYLYRYSTSSQSYPRKKDEFIEFIPKGEVIGVRVFASMRNSSSDVSGANITIDNMTDKKVVFHITSDDSQRPRVTIVSGEGDIIIKRDN